MSRVFLSLFLVFALSGCEELTGGFTSGLGSIGLDDSTSSIVGLDVSQREPNADPVPVPPPALDQEFIEEPIVEQVPPVEEEEEFVEEELAFAEAGEEPDPTPLPPEPDPTPLPPEPDPTPDPTPLPPEPDPTPLPPEPDPTPGACHRDGVPDLALLLTSDAVGTGLQLDSNAHLNVPGGAVVVNRDGAQSVLVKSNADLVADKLATVGKVSIQGNARVSADRERGTAVQDPYASVPLPPMGGLPIRSDVPLRFGGDAVANLLPGVYRGGISVDSNAEVTLAPGTYYLDGGDLSLDSNSLVDGMGGVRIVLDGGTLRIRSNSQLRLVGLEDDSHWSRFAIVGRGEGDLSLSSNTLLEVFGSGIYLPNTYLELNSNSDFVLGSLVIVHRLHLDSNARASVIPGMLPPCP